MDVVHYVRVCMCVRVRVRVRVRDWVDVAGQQKAMHHINAHHNIQHTFKRQCTSRHPTPECVCVHVIVCVCVNIDVPGQERR